MGKSAWKKFPYADKAFNYAGAALKKNWERLHRGDCEPFPADTAAQDAWRAYHAGEFAKAFETRPQGWSFRHQRGQQGGDDLCQSPGKG